MNDVNVQKPYKIWKGIYAMFKPGGYLDRYRFNLPSNSPEEDECALSIKVSELYYPSKVHIEALLRPKST